VFKFRNEASFYREELSAPRPTPQSEGPPIVSHPRLLIQYTRGYPPYLKPFLYPQPEDAPCHGDRDRLINALMLSSVRKYLGLILVGALLRVVTVV
jgi:hypothetical protein